MKIFKPIIFIYNFYGREPMGKLIIIFFTFILTITENKAYCAIDNYIVCLTLPYGAENSGIGECGVSYPNTLYSIFWNPANAPFLGDKYNCQLIYSFYHEKRLLRIVQSRNVTNILGVFAKNIIPYIDLSYLVSDNYWDYGEGMRLDSIGNIIDTYNGYDNILVNTIGVSFLKIIGIGLNIKNFKSKLWRDEIADCHHS
jgi:hypothetical protein